MPSTEKTTLSRLLAEIEAAWEERGDASLVERLAAEHPEHAEELFAFMDAILEEDADLPAGAGAAAVTNTLAWLAEEHRPPAAGEPPERPNKGAGNPPQDLMGFLVAESGKGPAEVAEALEDTPIELLAAFAQYPRLVKPPARRALAERVERGLGIDRRRVTAKLEEPSDFARAASRRGGYGAEPESYEDLLNIADLKGARRALWLRLGEDDGEGAR